MKYIDLFAGIGGFRNGINKAHSDWECVYSSEWNKYANSVYRKHFGECDIRDIREVSATELPDHDVLVGGFPCQSFSVAGKREGFNDIRGTMFFEIARILKYKRPRYFLLENVKGLLSHDSGKTFQTILGVLSELGYDVQWQVLNSKDFGVPQNRERVFIVGHLRGTLRPEVFPIGTGGQTNVEQGILAHTLNASDWRGANRNQQQTTIQQLNHPTHSNDRVYGEEGISPTLNTMQGGRRQPFVAIPVLTPDRAEKRQNGRRFKTDGEPAFTLTGQDIHGIFNGTRIRRLTPIECMRLQGFPDDWCDYGADGEVISDTQKYKMAGNAVTTNVITAIVERLV